MQVNSYDHTFSKQELYGRQVTLQNKIWVSFQTPRYLLHSIINEQSGFSAEQIKRDEYLGSKNDWL